MTYTANSWDGGKEFKIKEGEIDLGYWAARPVTRIPLVLREQGFTDTHCDSLTAIIGDLACDPRSGGIADTTIMANIFDVLPEQFRKNIVPQAVYIHRIGDLLVSNISSLEAHAVEYSQSVYERKCERIGVVPSSSDKPASST